MSSPPRCAVCHYTDLATEFTQVGDELGVPTRDSVAMAVVATLFGAFHFGGALLATLCHKHSALYDSRATFRSKPLS